MEKERKAAMELAASLKRKDQSFSPTLNSIRPITTQKIVEPVASTPPPEPVDPVVLAKIKGQILKDQMMWTPGRTISTQKPVVKSQSSFVDIVPRKKPTETVELPKQSLRTEKSLSGGESNESPKQSFPTGNTYLEQEDIMLSNQAAVDNGEGNNNSGVLLVALPLLIGIAGFLSFPYIAPQFPQLTNQLTNIVKSTSITGI